MARRAAAKSRPARLVGAREGVLAAGLGHPAGDGQAHEGAHDLVLGVPVGQGGDDRPPAAGTPSPSSAKTAGATRAIIASVSAEEG